MQRLKSKMVPSVQSQKTEEEEGAPMAPCPLQVYKTECSTEQIQHFKRSARLPPDRLALLTLLLLRYISSMLRLIERARMPGRPLMGGSFSGRSISAMLTRVAIASMAVGGLPTTWSPHGSSRDSISINLHDGRSSMAGTTHKVMQETTCMMMMYAHNG